MASGSIFHWSNQQILTLYFLPARSFSSTVSRKYPYASGYFSSTFKILSNSITSRLRSPSISTPLYAKIISLKLFAKLKTVLASCLVILRRRGSDNCSMWPSQTLVAYRRVLWPAFQVDDSQNASAAVLQVDTP